MPKSFELKVKLRGGAIRHRRKKLKGGKILHIDIVRKRGPRGGRTVSYVEEVKTKLAKRRKRR